MKCRFLQFVALVLFLGSGIPFGLHAVGHAEEPQQMVSRMLSDLKSQEDPMVVLKFVHWPSAYSSFPSDQLREMNVSSATELRGYFEVFFNDPSTFVKSQMKGRMDDLPPAQQAMMESRLDSMAQSMLQKRTEMKQKMSRAEYEIGEVQVQGEAATVELITRLDGEEKRKTLPLERHAGKWYLPTMRFFEGEGKKGASPGVPGM